MKPSPSGFFAPASALGKIWTVFLENYLADRLVKQTGMCTVLACLMNKTAYMPEAVFIVKRDRDAADKAIPGKRRNMSD